MTNAIYKIDGPMADGYDRLCTEMRKFMETQRGLGRLVANVVARHTSPTCALFEFGSGTGITTDCVITALKTVRCAYGITIVDPDPKMMTRFTHERVHSGNKNILEFHCQDVVNHCNSAVAEGKVWDIAYSAFTFHNVGSHDQEIMLRSIVNAIKPGGSLIYADYALRNPQDRLRAFRSHVEELFCILVEKSDIPSLREWVLHTMDDMSEDRVVSIDKHKERLALCGLSDVKAEPIGPLETLFSAIKPVSK